MRSLKFSAMAIFVLVAAMALAAPQAPTAQDHVAALKKNLGMSAAALKSYEWIETTVISLKGEEKARTEYRCYNGADGKLQRVPIGATPTTDKKKGLRGKIAGNKKEEISEYMKNAVELVKSYVPPDPARIEASKAAGKMSFTPAGSSMRIDFADYLKSGDKLTVELDLAKDILLGLQVATWMKDVKDAVALKAGFGLLNDGAMYPAEITLSAPSQSMEVKITNSGYKKM